LLLCPCIVNFSAADYYLTDPDYPAEAYGYVKKIPSRSDG
jgi:hypothetical protein